MRFTGISTSTEDARWIRSEAEMEVDALKIEGLNRNWRLDFLNSFGSKTNHVSPLAQPFNNLQRFLSSHTLTLRLHPPSRFPHTSASHKSTTNLAFQSSHSTTVILSTPSPSGHGGWITWRSTNRRGEGRSLVLGVGDWIEDRAAEQDSGQRRGNRRSKTVLALYDCFRCIVSHRSCCCSREKYRERLERVSSSRRRKTCQHLLFDSASKLSAVGGLQSRVVVRIERCLPFGSRLSE